jgi:predicted PurR-regulated permease PerM
MSVFGIKYAMLISIIVGVTNIIPFFGPFIGAVPSIFFLLINDFWQAVWFTVFIIILQQVDGNIIGPKILGSTIGLSAFWVIFAIIIMNGLFGLFGMFVGVPLFAVIYTLIKEYAENKLSKKTLPVDTEEYVLSKNKVIESGDKNFSEEKTQESIFNKIENLAKKATVYIQRSKKSDKADETDDEK